jgi:hypothetical protein
LVLDKEIMMKDRVLMFSEYRRRVKPTLLRIVTEDDIAEFSEFGAIYTDKTKAYTVSISDADLESGSPKIGDMIAVSENNTSDQWLVNQKYFHENFHTEPNLVEGGHCVILFK